MTNWQKISQEKALRRHVFPVNVGNFVVAERWKNKLILSLILSLLLWESNALTLTKKTTKRVTYVVVLNYKVILPTFGRNIAYKATDSSPFDRSYMQPSWIFFTITVIMWPLSHMCPPQEGRNNDWRMSLRMVAHIHLSARVSALGTLKIFANEYSVLMII